MGSESYHEPYEKLTPLTLDLHRAITSLMEELQAVDWYQQRIDATPDPDLKAVLAHNRDEEKEHAAMALEWIRRRDPAFDAALRTYLFTQGDVTAIEEEVEGKGKGEAPKSEPPAGSPASGARNEAAGPSGTGFGLTVGPLRNR
jgi:ferritin-like protein